MHLIIRDTGRHPSACSGRCGMATDTGSIGCDITEMINVGVIGKIRAMAGCTGTSYNR